MSDTIQHITAGSQVTLHFALATNNGTEITSTFDAEPATLTLGDGSLTENLEQTLHGLKAGEKQSLILQADNAFGPRDEEKTYPMAKNSFPAEMELESGLVVSFTTPAGDEVAGIIISIDEEDVMVDFNHPLAGQDIVFTVEIIDVINNSPTV